MDYSLQPAETNSKNVCGPSTVRTCFKKIELQPEIKVSNFVGCLIHYFMLSFVFVSVDSLQPLLLQQKFDVDKEQQIQNFKNMFVIAFDILVKCLTAPVFGYFADRFGRRNINLWGILWIALCMSLMPFTTQYYQYIVLRCFYAQGAIAISVIPLLADYVSQRSRGTCAAILVFMSSCGALSSAFLNFTILSHVSLEGTFKLALQYLVISAIILVLGLIYTLLFLKKGNTYYSASNAHPKKKTGQLCAIFKQSLTNPQISTGYMVAFLARSDSILLSLYLVLWTYSFHEYDYQTSSTKASELSGIAYTVIMLSCILYGYAYERKNVKRRNVMICMLSVTMIGTFLINLANQIESFVTYVSLSVLGLGMSGLLTASLYLINEFSNPDHRGFITGIQTFFGIIGITLQTFLGALLYEYASSTDPFNIFGAGCLLSIILTIILYKKGKKKQKGSEISLFKDESSLIQESQQEVETTKVEEPQGNRESAIQTID